MKESYKGYEILVHRTESMAGYELLYYSIFRESDLYECTSGYEDSAETVEDMIGYMKNRIDAEELEDNPWMEHDNTIKGAQ